WNERSDQVVYGLWISVPVNPSVFLGKERRIGRPGMILGNSPCRPVFKQVKCLKQLRRPEFAQPFREGFCVISVGYGNTFLEEYGAGVHTFVNLHDTDAGAL